MKHFFTILLAITCVPFANADDPVKIPFDTIKTRHMVVEVKINDKGPYRMIFDTGAPATLLSQKAARDSGVLTGKPNPFALFGSMGQKKIKNLKFGDLSLDGLDAMVLDHPIVEALAKAVDQPLEGIIGFNVFGRYDLTIDYQAKLLTLAPGKYQPIDMMQSMMKIMTKSIKEAERIPVHGPKGMLGMRVGKAKDDGEPGIDIEEVFEAGPAAKAGLKVGDRLLTINGRWTDQVADCFEAMTFAQPAAAVRLEIVRAGKKQVLRAEPTTGF